MKGNEREIGIGKEVNAEFLVFKIVKCLIYIFFFFSSIILKMIS